MGNLDIFNMFEAATAGILVEDFSYTSLIGFYQNSAQIYLGVTCSMEKILVGAHFKWIFQLFQQVFLPLAFLNLNITRDKSNQVNKYTGGWPWLDESLEKMGNWIFKMMFFLHYYPIFIRLSSLTCTCNLAWTVLVVNTGPGWSITCTVVHVHGH